MARHFEEAELLVVGLRRVACLEIIFVLRRWNSARNAEDRCPLIVF
jgi:hypothetical protein